MAYPNASRRDSEIRGTLVEVLRFGFLEQLTGRLEWQGGGHRGLFLRRGQIFLDRDGEWAERLAPVIRKATDLERPNSDPEVRRAAEWLAQELTAEGHGSAAAELSSESPGGVELTGPVPTLSVLLEAAVHGCDERQLIARLGGEKVRLESDAGTPALGELSGLDADMARMFAQLENPASLGELMRGMGNGRLPALRGLARLWAVGLVKAQKPAEKPAESELVTPKIVRRFEQRLAASLDEDPVHLDPETHRDFVVECYEHLHERNHYELLNLDLGAGDAEVLRAFQEFARQVHPSQAERLGMTGMDEGLRVLFERAVEAYLVLSDPPRRSSYNTLQGLQSRVTVGRRQRAEEKQQLARSSYFQALGAVAQMDYSQAVELLKEATRLDPQVKYMKALASAQAKNPNWRRHAVETYQRAAKLEPDDAAIHLGMAQVLEAEERLDEARSAYQACLERMPDNPQAQSGLQRLGGRATSAGGLRSALGRSR
ncbi:MAG: tetratricopeptide repeat protein [Thermoanaerobaculia bacterium]|nr:tetratricopeptide repeat protein [Thermoanaerobaculia bacterium]